MESNINAEGLALFIGQLVFLALIIERATAQVKNLVRCDLSRPWPIVAFVFSLIVVASWSLPLVEMIVGIPATSTLAKAVDTTLLSLWISGGAAAIINTVKKAVAARKEISSEIKQ